MKKYVTLKIILILLFFIPKAIYAQFDPVFKATGDQTYCPGSSFKNIALTASITADPLDPANPTSTTAPVTIQIVTGYESGKDVLKYVGTNPKISASAFEPQQGQITLKSSTLGVPVSFADLEEAIKNIQFSTTSTTVGNKDITILISNRLLSYLPRNGHYYEYVPIVPGPYVTWSQANAAANLETYYGRKGYLVTITKADEQKIAGEQAPGTGWIGAKSSDSNTAANWYWVTGPEGLASPKGTLFFTGKGSLGVNVATLDGKYNNWGTGEPNGQNGVVEYAQIIDPTLAGGKHGVWNDLDGDNNTGGGSLKYKAVGYIVEYGGMPGDNPIDPPLVKITFTIPTVVTYPIKSVTICLDKTATFTANLPANSTTKIYWYDALTGGTLLKTGDIDDRIFETPALKTTTTYYSHNGCSTPRTALTVNVTNVPEPTVTTPVIYNQGDTATPFPTVPDLGYTLIWYDATKTNIIASPPNPTPSTATVGDTSYFVSQVQIGGSACEGLKKEIVVTVSGVPVAPAAPATIPVPAFCQNEIPSKPSLSDYATPLPNCTLKWYSDATITSTIPTPTISTASTAPISYFVSQTDSSTGLESTRSEIKVTVNPLPLAPTASDISYTQGDTNVLPLTATPDGNNTLKWYDDAGSPLASAPTPSTALAITMVYYVSQIITATGCEGPKKEIKVKIDVLLVKPNPPGVSVVADYCQNDTPLALFATESPNCTLNWFDIGGGQSTSIPIVLTANAGQISYFVSQTNTITKLESDKSEIKITVNALPTVKDVTFLQCDTDLIADGKTIFDLTTMNSQISANFAKETFTYYITPTGANTALATDLISNNSAFTNTTPSTMEVWARVANTITGCHSVAKVTLVVPATNIPLSFTIAVPPVCDDFVDAINNNRDGIATFDFSSTKATLLAQLPATQVYDIAYYKNQTDAQVKDKEITDISNYRNIGFPNSQDIWVRIESKLDASMPCAVTTRSFFTLKVEALPTANPVPNYTNCGNSSGVTFSFNTSSLETTLLGTQSLTDVTVTYLDKDNNPLKDATGALVTSPFPNSFTTGTQTISAVVTNISGLKCSDQTTIQFNVDTKPQVTAIDPDLAIACDDEKNPLLQDGKFAFDTSTFEATILGGQNGMIVKYFDKNNNPLPSPLPNPFNTTTQTVKVTVVNPNNTSCSTDTTIDFVVIPLPNIDLNFDGSADKTSCSNLPFSFTIDAGIQGNTLPSNYTYIWTKDGNDLPNTTPTLNNISKIGIYTVQVTNASGEGCPVTRKITVSTSNIPEIDFIDYKDFTDVNTVIVHVKEPGDYQYSLDGLNGFWQDSNIFNNVSLGTHKIYVKNGCGFDNQMINIIGAPKFFTPNNDGNNDFWNIKGLDAKNSKSKIYVYDRYGKLIKQWIPFLELGWDGNYNRAALPAEDYWYTFKLVDGREVKGHFSLVR